ncbi:hypothetical protein CU669_01660 [Paramagnetospirillum kuznetsovii]|uniref:Uncharacterized protein n=1 Tax=Paramagnetospirillum kuznetsovii TaxID=2053833 RepID=A0A364P399_9PROT|nr:hypothetical protein [Paramagnetospirillum kuznetsovii]RAU23822.1 hypothetical protein CU669_01660 [Paramagnetospirillum kuznetsovii]
MARIKYTSRISTVGDTEPFTTAEEAWLWYARCQIARDDGVRFHLGRGDVARPCEPDDIVREVQRLYRVRVLRRSHLTVLGRFGRQLTPPNPHGGDGQGEAILWDEALDRLTTPLRNKGIVG